MPHSNVNTLEAKNSDGRLSTSIVAANVQLGERKYFSKFASKVYNSKSYHVNKRKQDRSCVIP